MAVQSWDNSTVEKLSEKLAEQYLAGREIRQHVKQAGVTDWYNRAAAGWKSLKPWQQGLLAGTGGGAILGGLSSLGRDEEERQPWQSALTGGVAGGLLGAGLGGAYQAYQMPQGPAPAPDATAGLRPADIANMPSEQIRDLDPSQIVKADAGSNQILNAIDARQRQLVQQARDEAGYGWAPGVAGTGVAGAGVLGAEAASRQLRPKTDLLGLRKSDIARAMGLSTDAKGNFSPEALNKTVDELGMTLTDAEILGEKIKQRQQNYAIAKRMADAGNPIAATAVSRYGHDSPVWDNLPANQPKLRPGLRVRLKEHLSPSPTQPYPDVPDLNDPHYEKMTDPRERVRRLADTGRAVRRSGPRSNFRRGGYVAALGLPLLLNWLANRAAKNNAERQTRDLLNMD
jgi:hypothetical protein